MVPSVRGGNHTIEDRCLCLEDHSLAGIILDFQDMIDLNLENKETQDNVIDHKLR